MKKRTPTKFCRTDNLAEIYKPFSEEEIKKALWNLRGDKSLGPDGFQYSFTVHFGTLSKLISSGLWIAFIREPSVG